MILITSGVSYSIGPGSFSAFDFPVVPATSTRLNGSFSSEYGAEIMLMTPADFSNLSVSSATFACLVAAYCFTTGIVSSGELNVEIPYVYNQTGSVVNASWFIVQQNPNATAETDVFWSSTLVLSYFDIYE
ncbi:MAG: hypothetical protein WBG19_02380 [Thermoplasmata archaeon]